DRPIVRRAGPRRAGIGPPSPERGRGGLEAVPVRAGAEEVQADRAAGALQHEQGRAILPVPRTVPRDRRPAVGGSPRPARPTREAGHSPLAALLQLRQPPRPPADRPEKQAAPPAVGRDALCAGPFARAPAAQRQGNGAPERRPPGADRAGRRQPGVGVTDHAEQVERLLAESEQLQDGPAKVALIGQAAAVADSHNDVELAFCVRKGLLGACLSADQCELMLVTFTWCLAQHDRDPERFPAERLLWEFRWVVSSLAFFPEMTRTRIEEMQAE